MGRKINGHELELSAHQRFVLNFFAITLKALSKIIAGDILDFFILFFRDNKTWHFL